MSDLDVDARGQDELSLRRTEAPDGEDEHEVPLVDLLPDAFIQRNTDFETAQALFDASGLTDPDQMESEEFSRFIADHTRFGGWQEMIARAGEDWLARQRGL